jgi:hypothetical protein
MNATRFNLTFEVITERSAEQGDFARHGFLPRSGDIPRRTYMPKNPHAFTLREAIEIMARHNSGFARCEADSCPVSRPRWLTIRGEIDDYPGMPDALGVSLHIPETVSTASARRIARLLGCYGLPRFRSHVAEIAFAIGADAMRGLGAKGFDNDGIAGQTSPR